jgi:hypothetical protein
LQSYYTGLVGEADAFVQIARFDAALEGKEPDAAMLAQIRSLRKAAKAREQSSEHLGDLYESLGLLMNYNARTAVQGAASKLQGSLSFVGDNPISWHNISIDPLQVLQQIDRDIEIARQEKRIEHQAPVVLKTVRVVTDLFEKEAPVYVDLQRKYLIVRRDFGKALLAKGEAIPDTILASQLSALGLRYNPGPVIDEKERAAINTMLDDSTDKAIETLEPRTQRIIRKLRALEAAHARLTPQRK